MANQGDVTTTSGDDTAAADGMLDAERLRLALSAVAIIGTWAWEVAADRFTVDASFAAAFGLDPALGREGLSLAHIVETVHPDDHAGLAAAINAALARGGPCAHQYRVRRGDGAFDWIEANGRVDLDEAGVPVRFLGVLMNIDARLRVEAERDHAESRTALSLPPSKLVVVRRQLNGQASGANLRL